MYKPGNVSRAPPVVIPHQPRLDWQMWFAALGPHTSSPWFTSFVHRLLQGQRDGERGAAPSLGGRGCWAPALQQFVSPKWFGVSLWQFGVSPQYFGVSLQWVGVSLQELGVSPQWFGVSLQWVGMSPRQFGVSLRQFGVSLWHGAQGDVMSLAVIRLVQVDESLYPFSARPPLFIRARLYKYWFTSSAEGR